MANSVNFDRLGRGLFLLVLVGAVAGCGSGDDTSQPSSDPPAIASSANVEPAGLEVDEFAIVDISAITAGFLPEITEGDVEVTESGAGTSYSYTFPTRELTGGVKVDLQARWDPVGDGLQPGLEWKLAGDGTSPTEFGFVVSIPKSFGESPAEITFDPQPTEIIDADVVASWTVDPIKNPIITALSSQLVQQGDPSVVIMKILEHLNAQRIHAELVACHSPFRDAETIPQCYLAVVTRNAQHFGTRSCDSLEKMIVAASADGLSSRPYHGFAAACGTVVELASSGATGGCERLTDDSDAYAGCLTHVSRLMTGECPVGDAIERQICVYDVAVALEFGSLCSVIRTQLGNAEMANDCLATTMNDPKYCVRTEDARLRASCCEIFRGTDVFDACLGTPDATEEDATTTAPEETTTTEPGEEALPLAIPTGVYTGSFDARNIADYFSLDSGVPHINTINILIDDAGSISGDLYAYQTGSMLGCPGADMKYLATIDPGQVIGPTLPQTVTATVEMTWHETFVSKMQEMECIPPVAVTEVSSAPLVFESIQNGVLTGIAGRYLQFELE